MKKRSQIKFTVLLIIFCVSFFGIFSKSFGAVTTITVGTSPTLSTLVGTNLYVTNQTTPGTVSVIDTNTNTVTSTINVGNNPHILTTVGTKLYVSNFGSGTVSIIDTSTDTVDSIPIAVGTGPQFSILSGSNLYVSNQTTGNISVIDTNTNTVITTIIAQPYLFSLNLIGKNLYACSSGSTNIAVIDINTNTLTNIIPVGLNPQFSTHVGKKLYVNNIGANTVSIIDVTYNLTYTAGVNGSITGNTSQTVNYTEDASSVTAVSDLGYHFVSWSDGVLTASRTDTNITSDSSVSATFAIDTHTLTYTAGANGSITGTSPQTIDYGSDGTQVIAEPSSGYHFVDWSDGVLTASRTDINVTDNISVTANFANNIISSGSYINLSNGTKITNPVVTQLPTYTFTKTLKYRMTNNEVKELQKYLNTHNYPVATIGAGSPGNETNYFGLKTKSAVIKFQLANGLKGDGIVGVMTRGKVR